jgi:hypothetical protein
LTRAARPVFLERGSYRRRRLLDALRLVPVLGVILWMIPVVWPEGSVVGAEPVRMSRALFYIFGIWCVMIALAAVLSLLLPARTSSEDKDLPGESE